MLGIPKEDATILLSMPWQVAFELRKGRGEVEDGHESNKGHLARAEGVYEMLASSYSGWTKVECAPERTLDSLRRPEDIHEEVYSIAKGVIQG